jgi:hypothetical protein
MKNTTATVVSYILHPLLVPTYIIALLLNMNVFLAFMIPFNVRLMIIGMLFTITFAMPAMVMYMMQRRGIISSLQMEIRSERFYPLLLTAIFWGLGFNLISRTGLPTVYYQYLLGGVAAIVIAMIINYFWKISLHMLGMGGLTGVFLGFALRIGIDIFPFLAFLIFLSGLVGYARLKENSHNPPQVYVGYIVGVILMIVVYMFPLI